MNEMLKVPGAVAVLKLVGAAVLAFAAAVGSAQAANIVTDLSLVGEGFPNAKYLDGNHVGEAAGTSFEDVWTFHTLGDSQVQIDLEAYNNVSGSLFIGNFSGTLANIIGNSFTINLTGTNHELKVTGVLGGAIGGLYSGTIVVLDDSGSPIATVPLPAAAWLFGSALIGLVAVARRKAVV